MISICRWLFLGFLLLLPLAPESFGIASDALPDISLIRLVIVLLLLGLVGGLFLDPAFREQLTNRILANRLPVLLIATFFIWRLFCSAASGAGMSTLFTAVRDIVYYGIPFTLALVTIRKRRDIDLMIIVLAIAAGATVFIGLYEWAADRSLYAFLTPDDSAWNTRPSKLSVDYEGVLASFPNPLAFGSFLVAPCVFVCIGFIASRDVRVHLFIVLTLCIFSLGIFLSMSRGALAGLLTAFAYGSVLFLVRVYKRIRRNQRPAALVLGVVPVFLFVTAGLAFAAFELAQGVGDRQLRSGMMRLLQLNMGLPLIAERPVLGYGVGQAGETLGMLTKTVDNYYLTITIESGIPGLLIFVSLLTYFVIQSGRTFVRLRDPYSLALAMFFVAQCIQMIVLSLKQAIPILYVAFAVFLTVRAEEAGASKPWTRRHE